VRIAFFVSAFPLPSETFILGQITGMIARGHEVDIYAEARVDQGPVHPDVERYGLMGRTHIPEPVPVGRVRRVLRALSRVVEGSAWRHPAVLARALDVAHHGRAAASLTLLYEALPLLERGPYDVLHCQFGTVGARVVTLRQIGAATGKLVTSFRGYDAPRGNAGDDARYDELFKEGDLFLPVSAALRRRLIDAGCDALKIEVLHSGIDLARLVYAERHLRDGEPLRVVTIARLVEKKGVIYALRAIARLVAAGRTVTYTVAGDGVLRPELERAIAELGLDSQVRLLGWQSHDEVIRLCKAAHVLVAPSVTASNGDQEGIPNAVKEAMAMGLPVVSTWHGGIPELVGDRVSGLLVPERDEAALAGCLAYLLDHPEAWPAMTRAARARVEAEYDIEKLNDTLEALSRSA